MGGLVGWLYFFLDVFRLVFLFISFLDDKSFFLVLDSLFIFVIRVRSGYFVMGELVW